MEAWQLTLLILMAVLVGALLPALVLLTLALQRAASTIHSVGVQLTATLDQVQVIAERVEKLSRGLEGSENDVAHLMSALNSMAHTVERNAKVLDLATLVAASAGPAVAAFIKVMRGPDEPGTHEKTGESL